MAGFERPKDAVLASIENDRRTLAIQPNRFHGRSALKSCAQRQGHCLRLNDRIDYFGQDLNIAARVQGLAGVNEVCLTEAVMEAPGVSNIVKGRRRRATTKLKGIGQKDGNSSD